MTVLTTELPEGKCLYFASDFHLGAPDAASSAARERKLIRWLEHIRSDAAEVYLVGDIFDFWFEYKHVIPKGFTRLLGKLAELSDAGIRIHFFTGNHDMWMFDYFPTELGIELHREPIERIYNGKKWIIGHGDGLGPGDVQYKLLKKIFANPLCQWAFGWLHPNIGMWIAQQWSRKSRLHNLKKEEDHFLGEREYLLAYCKEVLQQRHVDFFIFGHRHLPLDIPLTAESRYVNLGEWIRFFTYARFKSGELELLKWES